MKKQLQLPGGALLISKMILLDESFHIFLDLLGEKLPQNCFLLLNG